MNKIISLFRRDKPADRQRSMSEIVAFSAILFAIIFTAGVISFRVSMRYVISLSKKGELTQMLEIERIKRDVFINEMTPIIEEMSVALRFSQGFGTSFTKTQMSEVADLHSNSFKLISWINHSDRILHIYDPHFFDPNHFTDGEFTVGDEALDTSLPENSWYYTALSRTYAFYFHIKDEMLWLNAPVFDNDGRPVGVVGIGIYQSEFVQEFYRGHDEKTQIYLYNPAGEITVSRGAGLKIDIERVLSVAKRLDSGQTTTTFSTNIGEVAVGVIPSMGWYSVAVSPNSLDDFINPVAVVFMVLLLVIALIFVVFNIFIGDVIKSLRAALTSLETTSQYKDKFFATVSHEMRTPMNAIIGIAQIELQKDDITEEHAGALEKIYASGNGLLGIVNDLLDMSKMASGKLDLAPTAYDMPSLINDAVQVNVVRIGSKPIEFMLDVDENLPSSLFGDELRLKQILNNLLSNAIKYTDEGHVKLSVNHTICGEEAILRFVVEDTGQGMKEEDCKRLFSEYARFNTEANRSTEGAGLGLNITKRLVEMMRGTITAESEYGKGTTFTVELKQGIVKCRPIGEELAVKLNNFTFSGEKQVSKLRLNREYMPYGKVLVVDDVDTNLFVAKGLLMPYGINVETVNSGFAALDKIKEGNVYDIVFMDHMMPEMDGIETTKKMRAFGYNYTVIALTANALVGNDEMFKRNGFDGFISKPIDIRYLDEALKKFIRDKQPPEVIEEAKKQKPKKNLSQEQSSDSDVSKQLAKIFAKDAEKAVAVIESVLKKSSGIYDDDLHLFTINAHAMKSTLASIQETALSKIAFGLEEAGRAKDKEKVLAEAPEFVASLKAVIEKIKPKEESENQQTTATDSEDIEFLREKMGIIRAACEEYDKKTIKNALNELKEKTWSQKTNDLLEEISEQILHGEFEKAAELAQA